MQAGPLSVLYPSVYDVFERQPLQRKNSIWIVLEDHSAKLRWRKSDSRFDVRRERMPLGAEEMEFLTYPELVEVLLDPCSVSCVRETTTTEKGYSPGRPSSVVSAALVCGKW